MSCCFRLVLVAGGLLTAAQPLRGGARADTDVITRTAAVAATMVQNRDEPTRNRFQEAASVTCSAVGDCAVLFPVVAVGKRVGVEHVSCSIAISSSGTVVDVVLGTQQARAVHEYLPMTANYGIDSMIYNVVNVMTLVYFVPGETPRIDAFSQGTPVSAMDCSLVGYATNAP